MKYFWLLIMLFSISCGISAQTPIPLSLQSKASVQNLRYELTDAEWRWVGKKSQLRVAIWGPQNPPFGMIRSPGIYTGISADYLKIMVDQLHVDAKIIQYDNRDDALQALSRGEVEMMIDDPGAPDVDHQRFATSVRYVPDNPALVAREETEKKGSLFNKTFSLAVPADYLTDPQIAKLYPHAVISRFSSGQSALAALAYGSMDYALENSTTATYIIERNYTNRLTIDDIITEDTPGARFVFRRNDETILSVINKIITSISGLQHHAIINYWLLGSDFQWLSHPIVLTPQEDRWIKSNPVVKVAINPVDAPVAIEGTNGTYYGISIDLLKLISLRTNIQFEMVSISDASQALQQLKTGQVDMLGSITWSQKRDLDLIYSQPWLSSPFVLVVKNNADAPQKLSDKLTLATVAGNGIEEQLSAAYPDIVWKYVENRTLALRLVEEGKVDGAVHTKLGADFLIDRYFRGKLKVAGVVGSNNARYAYALKSDDRELESILNKTLADIPPRAYAKIINKWQGIPEVPLQTWRVYSTQQIIIAVLAGVLIIASLLWAFLLRRSMKIRQRAQIALQRELNFRESLLQGSPVPIYVINSEGHIISRNASWDAFFVDADSQLLALPLYDTRHPLAPVLPVLQNALATNDQDAHKKYEHKVAVSDGKSEHLLAHWATRLTGDSCNEIRLICGWQDITAQETLLAEVSHEKDNAQQANKAKSTFLATMSHEIRTPVSAIIGLLEIAEQSRKAETQDGEALRLAYISAQSLMELIGDVLDMSRIESGKLELAPSWGNIKSLLSEITSTFEGLTRKKQLYLYWDSFTDEEFELLLDYQRVKQVLFNFVGNAIKFTQKGGIKIDLSAHFINDAECEIHITIEDTGAGISEEDQSRLFQPYSQLDAGKKQAGTGLGLVISAEIMQQMGGTIKLDSQLGFGTTVVLSFSAPYRLIQPAAARSADDNTSISLATRKHNVLIVDDHTTNRLVLQRQLEMLGHEVCSAANGMDALALWEDGDFDLIITDCQMPVMNGFDLTRALRKRDPVIMIWGLTANAQENERQACITAGMNACIFKPITQNKLQDLFEQFFTASNAPLEQLRQIIDLDNLSTVVMGHQGKALAMLQDACAENAEDMAEIVNAVEQNDDAAVKKHLHRLIGAAELLGADEIKRVCVELRQLIESGRDTDLINVVVATLAQLLNQLDQLTRQALGETKE